MAVIRQNLAHLRGNGTAGNILTGGSIGNFDKADSFSISMWLCPRVKLAGAPYEDWLISSVTTDANQRGWMLTYVNVGAGSVMGLRFIMSSLIASDRYIAITDADHLQVDVWRHVVVTWNASAAEFYVDGLLRRKATFFAGAPSGTTADAGRVLRLLTETSGGSEVSAQWDMDDVALIAKALSAAEVAELYNGGAYIDPTSLSFWTDVEDWFQFEDEGTEWPTCTGLKSGELTAGGTWGSSGTGISRVDVPYFVGRMFEFQGNIAEYTETGSDGFDITDEGASYLLAPTTPASAGLEYRQLLAGTLYTEAERWRQRLRYTRVTAGIMGVGIWTPEGNKVCVAGMLNTSNGKLSIHVATRDLMDNQASRATTGTPVLSSSNGDVIEMVFELDRHTLYLEARNVTTGAAPIRLSYATTRTDSSGAWSHPPSNGKPALLMMNGTARIAKAGGHHQFDSKDLKHPRYLVVGASIDVGCNATTYAATYAAQARAAQAASRPDFGGSFVVNAGGGDGIASASLRDGVGEEIDLIGPECVLMHIGHVDDLGAGLAATQAAYTTLRNNLMALDSVRKIVHLLLSPLDSKNVSVFHAHQQSLGDPYIDIYTLLKGAGTDLSNTYDIGDGTHLNDAGEDVISTAIATLLASDIPEPVAIQPARIETLAAVNTPAVMAGAVSVIIAAAIAGASVLAPTIVPGAAAPVTVEPARIETPALVLEPSVNPGTISIQVARIESSASVLEPVVIQGAVAILPARVETLASVLQPTVIAGTGAQGYWEATQALGPDVLWELGEASGTVVVDSSGNGYTGQYDNTPALGQPSIIPNEPGSTAVLFDNAQAEWARRNPASDSPYPLTATDTFTAFVWIKPTDLAASRDVMGMVEHWQLWINAGGTLYFHCSPAWTSLISTVAVSAGVSSMVAIRKTPTTISIIINGVERGNTGHASNLASGNNDLRVGGSSTGGGRTFHGVMQGFTYLVGTALTDQQLLDLYNLGTTVSGANVQPARIETLASVLQPTLVPGASVVQVPQVGALAAVLEPTVVATSTPIQPARIETPAGVFTPTVGVGIEAQLDYEFQEQFESLNAVLMGTSTTRRPDAISLDYLTAFAPGPIALQDATQGLVIRPWRVIVSGSQIVLARGNNAGGWDADIPLSVVLSGIVEIDLAFTQNADPTLVAQRNDGHIWIYWFDPLVPGFVWADMGLGRTPRIVLDDVRPETGINDVQVFYVSDAAGTVVQRQQRDRYAVVYEVPIVTDENTYLEDVVTGKDRRLHIIYSIHNVATGKYSISKLSSLPFPLVLDPSSFGVSGQVIGGSLVEAARLGYTDPASVEVAGQIVGGSIQDVVYEATILGDLEADAEPTQMDAPEVVKVGYWDPSSIELVGQIVGGSLVVVVFERPLDLSSFSVSGQVIGGSLEVV